MPTETWTVTVTDSDGLEQEFERATGWNVGEDGSLHVVGQQSATFAPGRWHHVTQRRTEIEDTPRHLGQATVTGPVTLIRALLEDRNYRGLGVVESAT